MGQTDAFDIFINREIQRVSGNTLEISKALFPIWKGSLVKQNPIQSEKK